jgi:succinate-semialdehyde dehydrogenase / glutarate-semialdehyde dehydrogenase
MLESRNPSTGETLRTYPVMSAEETENCIRTADSAFQAWKSTSFPERAERLKHAAKTLLDRKEEYSRLMSLEMGKPIRAARSEIEKCAWVCDYFAESAASMLTPEFFATDATRSYVAFQPLGVILAVMPWNYPFWQVFRFAAPALMAGNSAVLKHASNVTGCALAVEDIFRVSGFPEHLFQCLRIPSEAVSAAIEHPSVRAVTLTGSTRAGRAVASKAGQMLKKTVLELGGSDPYVILEDADLEKTVEACVASRLLNSGQSCIAAKRFIVPESVRERFEQRLVELMGSKQMGDPLDERTEIGPLARSDLRDALHGQVRDSIARGAKCLLGGVIPDGPGAYYPPTVLSGVGKGMPAYEEETFGPVASVITVRDESEAIRVANDSSFGLGAAVFSRDDHHAEWLALSALEAGNCFVNAFVKSDPRLPFGGVKESGYGRELGIYGIREFVNIKTVYVG